MSGNSKLESGTLNNNRRGFFGSLIGLCAAPFVAKAAVEPSVSMTRSDLMLRMIQQPSPLMAAWGMDDPLNVEGMRELLGLSGDCLTARQYNARSREYENKLLAAISAE